MPKLVLEVPSEVVDAVRLPPEEMGKARVLAHLTRWEFEQLLGERQIPRHYSRDDFDEDLAQAHGHR